MSNRKYSLVYADPPWQYNDKSKNRGGAERHYPTMSTGEIANMDIGSLCADNSLLFIWVTLPLIDQGLMVLESWGFEYKTCGFVWVKRNKNVGTLFVGMGHYTRSNAEICLIGKRGAGLERLDKTIRQTQIHRISEHSSKPIAFRSSIEALYGNVKKVELFARNRAKRWDAFGNQVDGSITIPNHTYISACNFCRKTDSVQKYKTSKSIYAISCIKCGISISNKDRNKLVKQWNGF